MSSLTISRFTSDPVPGATSHTARFVAADPVGFPTTAVFVFQQTLNAAGAVVRSDFICVATYAQLQEIAANPADTLGPAPVPYHPVKLNADVECTSCTTAAPAAPVYIRLSEVTLHYRRRDDMEESSVDIADRVARLLREYDASLDLGSAEESVVTQDGAGPWTPI